MASDKSEVEEIFFSALEKGSADELSAYLDKACKGNGPLRSRVQMLLDVKPKLGSFLQGDAGDIVATIDQPVTEQPGDTIGPYKLLQQIGEGGMGVVYMAEQTEPVSRRVALKVIKPGMDSRQVIARFESERQALAMMDHPNIAKVLDAGTTDAGRPYFVIELVKGISITQYCDEHKLSVRERLELFVPVCQAIQHAHQKGIIHRDIKPSNVLVARYDDHPVPKIIDFGVAKAVEQRLTEKTVFTQFGQIVGTFEYMSPEQAQLNQLDVDTRSDVYSLGVLLYELLTGETPFDGERLRSAAFDELLRIIREEDPLRPSARLSTSSTLSESAAKRKVEPKRLSSVVQGELDWIVMKALEKDRTRRYETAAALGADVEHYLDDEPVEACPPSSIYMLGKFARRNKGWLSTAAAILAMAFVGLTMGTILIAKERDAAEASARREAIAAAEADRQRQRAEENLRESRKAVDRLFTRAAEELANVPHMTEIRRALLEDAAEFYERFVEQESTDPKLRAEMGRAYQRLAFVYEFLGRLEDSIASTQQALDIFSALHADYPKHVHYANQLRASHHTLGTRLFFVGRTTEARRHTERALELAEELVKERPDNPVFHQIAAGLHGSNHRLPAGKDTEVTREQQMRRALEMRLRIRRRFPDFEPGVSDEAHTRHWLGEFLRNAGRFDEAEQELSRSVSLYEEALDMAPENRLYQERLAHAAIYLGELYLDRRQPDRAEEHFARANALVEPLFRDFPNFYSYHINLRWSIDGRARAAIARGDLGKAEELLLRLRSHHSPDDKHRRAISDHAKRLYLLGLIYHFQDRVGEAAEMFREALSLSERAMGEVVADLMSQRQVEERLGWALATCPMSQFRDAGRSIVFFEGFLRQDPESSDYWNALGIGKYRASSLDDAIEALGRSIELGGDDNISNYYFLAMAHWRRDKKGEAHQWYQRGVAKEQHDLQVLDLELTNFRRETEKLLGIEDHQSANAAELEKKDPGGAREDIEAPAEDSD